MPYNFDTATPEQRRNFDFLHSHAYDWASARGEVNRDNAERYAGHVAGTYYDADPQDWPNHPSEYQKWDQANQ